MATLPLSESQRRLDALTDLVLEVSAQRNVGDLLDVALRQCLRLTESQFGFVGLVNAGQQVMEIVAIHGFPPGRGGRRGRPTRPADPARQWRRRAARPLEFGHPNGLYPHRPGDPVAPGQLDPIGSPG